jgi:hypothetical protein
MCTMHTGTRTSTDMKAHCTDRDVRVQGKSIYVFDKQV